MKSNHFIETDVYAEKGKSRYRGFTRGSFEICLIGAHKISEIFTLVFVVENYLVTQFIKHRSKRNNSHQR